MIGGIAGSAVRDNLKILTDFGDTGVLLPLSIVVFIWLLATSTVRTALFWLLILVLSNALLGVLKVYFLSCPAGAALHSPSGHAGFAIFVYGSLTAAATLASGRRWLRAAIVALGTILTAGIATSRVILGHHNILEILIGAVVGGIALAIFVAAYRHVRTRRGPVILLGLAALIVAVIFHGERVSVENYLRHLGWEMGRRGESCGYR
jgi:membrane-associated phospholipid phosphatase